MFVAQKCYQNVLAIILIASLVSSIVFVQPGYSTIITSNNGSNTSNNNLDVSKEVFVVDYANIRIQKFDTDGKFITKWGTEGDAKGQFKIPHSVAVDSSGIVYVTDMIDLSVKKFTGDGNFIAKWGSKGSGDGEFRHPHGIAIDSSGSVYVTDMTNLNIQKFTGDGKFITSWGGKGDSNGKFMAPEVLLPILLAIFSCQILRIIISKNLH